MGWMGWMDMDGSVKQQALEALRAQGKRAYVRAKNGFFYSGCVVMVDGTGVTIDDRKVGNITLSLTELDEVREDRVGGRD
jgi:hypothetical protein